MASLGKKTRGRQKIEMKVIGKENDKLITFSKRRYGIYKKISEITTLCGTDILFTCFSPAGKLYSFGHPSVESVANRFLNANILPSNGSTHPLVEAYQKEKINQIILYYNEIIEELDATKGKQKILAQQASGSESKLWWETPIEELNLQELEELESRFTKHLNELYKTRSKKIADSINLNEDSY